MSTPVICVILCAFNPREDYLKRTLAALQAQTLPVEQWELLLIDNASTPPLAGRFDIAWHPRGRHLREERVGKTNAFLLGVRESTAPVLMIVDDDNLLAPNYLEAANRIARERPDVGAWGGNVRLCFEQDPPEWTREYWPLLAGRTVSRDEAVCNLELTEPLPVGAGCCIRREVAERYGQSQNTPWRVAMGRVGRGLVSGEDTDLAMTACDMGLKRGMFKDLSLDHLIPPQRLTEDYLARLVEGVRFSCYLLELLRHPERVPPPVNTWWKVKLFADALTKRGPARKMFLAYKNGQKRAREYYKASVQQQPPR